MSGINPARVQRIARIEINVMSDLSVQTAFNVPNRMIFNLAMETARQDGVMRLIQAEQQKVVLPEPEEVAQLKT